MFLFFVLRSSEEIGGGMHSLACGGGALNIFDLSNNENLSIHKMHNVLSAFI